MSFFLLHLVFLFVICRYIAIADGVQPLDIQLFHTLNRIGSFAISPNKENIIFTTSFYNRDENKPGSFISLLNILSGNLTQMTDYSPGTSTTNPLWLDDNTIAFLRKGILYKKELNSNSSPKAIFNPTVPINSVAYRPDEGVLSFIAWVYPNSTLEESATKKSQESARIDSARVYDNLWARHWNEWMSLEKPNIFAAQFRKSGGDWHIKSSVNLVELLPQYSDPLTRWYIEEYVISPSGDYIAFVVRPPTDEMAWSTNVDIYLAPTDGSTEPVLLTGNSEGTASNPAFSTDGKRLAWLQMETPGYEADINRIYLYNIASHETTSIARNWNLSPHSLLWSANNSQIFAVTGKHGRNVIFSVDVVTGARDELTKNGSASALHLVDDNRILYISSNHTECPNLHILDLSTLTTQKLTDVNQRKLKDIYLGTPEEFWFEGARGDKVHGWLFKPYNFNNETKYPLAYLVHGGPQQANMHSFGYSQWNPNMYASAGFVTVQINFHGSPSYGQSFTDSIKHNWGEYPYTDLMNGLDYVLDNYKFVDRDRLAALGGSFGAYMMNWINGHSNRFKCLVAHDGKMSTVSGYYGTDELWFPEWEFGQPWDPKGREILERNNPERFAANFSTPTLFIQGEKDFRIPVTESLGAWTLLRRRGIKSRLVYFPDEDHWVTRPGNSIRWYNEVIKWISQWTNSTPPYTI